jgi:catechol 2,3-dioxygenase-like lactoylglutathione lyase family enzyme
MLPPVDLRPAFNITRSSHVRLTVADLAESRNFYVNVLGLVVTEEDDSTCYLRGSNWPSTQQTQQLADMVGTGALDMSYLEHRHFPLSEVNDAIASLSDRHGGFSNYVIIP